MSAALLILAAALVFWQKQGASAPPPAGSSAASGSGGSPKTDRNKKGESGGGRGAPAPVVATHAHRGDIGVYFAGLGTVTPLNTVTVRSRVDGELTKIYYREGDNVHAGDPLIEIDPRPFQVQLEQAEGQLARDQATLANARIDLVRYEKLLKQNAVQEQVYTTQKSTIAQLEGTVKSDQGAVDAAKLQLTYCTINAPLGGRIGLRLVDPGNIVHASDTNGMLVITQIQPISVLFTIAEDQLQTVLRKLAANQHLPAGAYDREARTEIAHGSLTTVDNQIDPSTGTLRLRATFPNGDRRLFPNQFVNIRLLVQQKRGVVLIPTAAIQRTTTGTFVFVVKDDSTVTIRKIAEGVMEGEESEITSGVAPGEVVVLNGVDRLQEGSPVRPQFADEHTDGVKGHTGGAKGKGKAR